MAERETINTGMEAESGVGSHTSPPERIQTPLQSAPFLAKEVTLTPPAEGEHLVVPVYPGEKINLEFDLNSQKVDTIQDDLVIEFENNSSITLEGFALYAAGKSPPWFALDEGVLPGEELLEPAGGPAATSGGVGEYEDGFGDLLDGVGSLGALGATALVGGLGEIPEDEDDFIEIIPPPVDENDPPVAEDDFGSTEEDAQEPVVGNLLDNDSDPDGDPLTVVSVDEATDPETDVVGDYGTLDWNSDGTYSYTVDNSNPDVQGLGEGETLTDTFLYEITDGNGGTDTAVLTITIDGLNDNPDAVDNSYTVGEDATVGGNVVLDNTGEGIDSDPENDPLTVTEVNGESFEQGVPFELPSGAELTMNADGTYSYDPKDVFDSLGDEETAQDTFTYTITDGNGGFDTATVTITIENQNDGPDAVDNSYSVGEDEIVSGDVVLDNTGEGLDSDPENDPLTVTEVNGESFEPGVPFELPSGAELIMNADGTYSYDPKDVFDSLGDEETAQDTFTYTITDGNGGFDTATVTITVNGQNDGPDAVDNSYTVGEDEIVSGDVVLDNTGEGLDSDPENDPLTVTEINGEGYAPGTSFLLPSGAELTMNADGTYSYDPKDVFDYLGDEETAQDTFTYTITDGNGGFDTATVTVTIDGANDAPAAVNDINSLFLGEVVATNNTGRGGEDRGAGIYRLDAATGGYELLSTIETHIDDITYDPGGELWGIGSGTGQIRDLFTLNQNTGEILAQYSIVTVDGTSFTGQVDGLAFVMIDGVERIFATADKALYEITVDGDIAMVMEVKDLGVNGAVDLVSVDGSLYFLSTNNTLYKIDDIADGSYTLTEMGPISQSPGPYGMIAGVDGNLYFVSNDSSNPNFNEILVIDPTLPSDQWVVGGFDLENPQGEGAFKGLAGVFGNNTATGNVLSNDADIENDTLSVIRIEDADDAFDIPPGDSVDITGEFGTLTLFSNGEYVYTLDASLADAGGVDLFTYTVSDGNGGTDTANIIFNLTQIHGGTIVGDDADEEIIGSDESNVIVGLGGHDDLSGEGGDDALFGGDGNDILNGGSGHDVLFGDAGNDLLFGGSGNDELTGGEGSDTFIYSANGGEGNDTVTDFSVSEDVLRLTDVLDGPNPGVLGPEDVNNSVQVNGADVELTLNGTTTVTFAGINSGAFDAVTDLQGLVDAGLQVEFSEDAFA